MTLIPVGCVCNESYVLSQFSLLSEVGDIGKLIQPLFNFFIAKRFLLQNLCLILNFLENSIYFVIVLINVGYYILGNVLNYYKQH